MLARDRAVHALGAGLLACAIPGLQACAPQPRPGPNVIVLVVDTLRADYLQEYGFELETSAGIGAFTSRATRFERCYSTAPWTAPSCASLMTGQPPHRHGLQEHGGSLPSHSRTLAECFQAAGYLTAGFSDNYNVSRKTGFGQGFDTFEDVKVKATQAPDCAEMFQRAGTWVKRNREGSFLLYLQPMNVHGPYRVPEAHSADLLGRPPTGDFVYGQGPWKATMLPMESEGLPHEVAPEYVASMKEQYATAVRYTLDRVGAFLQELDALGVLDGSLVVLTSDHGEELFEQGGFGHGFTLLDEVLHVPLFVKLPGQREGRVLPQQVSLVDLLPTLCESAGLPATADVAGVSLLPLLEEWDQEPLARHLEHEVRWPKRCVGVAVRSEEGKLALVLRDYRSDDPFAAVDDGERLPVRVQDLQPSLPSHPLSQALQALLQLSLTRPTVLNRDTPEEQRVRAELQSLGYH